MKNIFILLLLASLWSCNNPTPSDQKASTDTLDNFLQLTQEQAKAIQIRQDTIQQHKINNTLRLHGIVEVSPDKLISISSALGGFVKDIRVRSGSYIRKGELLASLEDMQYIQLQEDYLKSKAQLQDAEANYLRQKELNANKASSDKEYSLAKTAFQSLLINSKSLEAKLRSIYIQPEQVSVSNLQRSSNLLAPFDGFVREVHVNLGKYVSPSDVLFELVNPKGMLLNLKVFEKDWGKLKVGQEIEVFSNSEPQNRLKARVSLIGKNIAEDRTVSVYAEFSSPNQALILGMYLNAEVLILGDATWAIPEESLLSYEGKSFVFEALGNNLFRILEVKPGVAGNGWVELQDSESIRGKAIVAEGAYTLLMALKNTAEE